MDELADWWMNRQIKVWTEWPMKEQMNWWMNKLMNEHGEQTDQNFKYNNKWK